MCVFSCIKTASVPEPPVGLLQAAMVKVSGADNNFTLNNPGLRVNSYWLTLRVKVNRFNVCFLQDEGRAAAAAVSHTHQLQNSSWREKQER